MMADVVTIFAASLRCLSTVAGCVLTGNLLAGRLYSRGAWVFQNILFIRLKRLQLIAVD
jgi:hypothetical protein